jgi:hypothetical protein
MPKQKSKKIISLSKRKGKLAAAKKLSESSAAD